MPEEAILRVMDSDTVHIKKFGRVRLRIRGLRHQYRRRQALARRQVNSGVGNAIQD
jgi:hypothetical protein